MRILVLNGSPKGENSITLQTVRYLEKRFPKETFEVLHVGQRIKSIEKDFSKAEEALKNADLLLFCYPVYTFLVPSQLHRFIELLKEHGVDLSGKCAAQISTSLHFYDITAHRFIRDNCDDLDLNYLGGLSADMEDLLKPQGRTEAEDFFRFLLWRKEHGYAERKRCFSKPFTPVPLSETAAPSMQKPGRVAIVADFDPDGTIAALSETLRYAVDHAYRPPKTFWGVGGMKIFRDLIYQMRGLMREDHSFYKKHGFYDFPQKRKGRIFGMYLVGGMMRSKRIQKKLSGKMTGGMLLPYKKVLEKTEPSQS